MKKNEPSLRDLWATTKRINICVIGVKESEASQKWAEIVFEDIMGNDFKF